MYKYRIINVRKSGKRNIYDVLNLIDGQVEELTLKELKPFFAENKVINAVYKGNQVTSTMDIAECLDALIKSLEGIRFVKIKIVSVSKSKLKSRMKIYNYGNSDITFLVYQVLHRFCDITMSDELEVSGNGMDMCLHVMNMINSEAKRCGMADILDSYLSV